MNAERRKAFRKDHQEWVKNGMRSIMEKKGFLNAHQFETECGLGGKTITTILENGQVSLFTMHLIGIGLGYKKSPSKEVLKYFGDFKWAMNWSKNKLNKQDKSIPEFSGKNINMPKVDDYSLNKEECEDIMQDLKI